MNRHETGILGEKLACDFLQKNGYKIIETNYRCPDGEIDIIARHGEILVFIEVRTKHSSEFGTPEESIIPSKMEKLRTVAAHYGQNRDNLPDSWRIDMVAVHLGNNNRVSRIDIIENAVEGV